MTHTPNSGILFSWINCEVNGYRSLYHVVNHRSYYRMQVVRNVSEKLDSRHSKPSQVPSINSHTFGIPARNKTVRMCKIQEFILTDPLQREMRRKGNEENSRWWWGRRFVFGGFITATQCWLQLSPTLHKRRPPLQMDSENCKKCVHINCVEIGTGIASITRYYAQETAPQHHPIGTHWAIFKQFLALISVVVWVVLEIWYILLPHNSYL